MCRAALAFGLAALVFGGCGRSVKTKLPPTAPTVAPTPSAEGGTFGVRGGLTHYVNPWWGIEMDYPSSWVPDPNYGGSIGNLWTSYADVSGRGHGFVYLTLLSAPSLDAAVDGWAHHKLRPFGGAPVIEDVSLPAGPAKRILPDPASPDLFQASIIMPLPAQLDGRYDFFELDAHRANIEQLARSVRLTVPSSTSLSPP